MKRLLFTLATLACLPGCGTPPSESAAPSPSLPKPAARPEPTVTFIISGDTAGFIVPCGCTTKQFGGLPRRASYLAQAREKFGLRVLYLDAGGNISRGTPYDQVKLEYILKGEALMRASAVNLGLGEVSLAPAKLQALAPLAPLLSSHIFPPRTKDEVWLSSVEHEYLPLDNDPAVRVAVYGINLKIKQGYGAFAVGDPRDALRADLAGKNADLNVLLAYGDEHDALKLAADFPELAAVFIAGCGQSIAPRSENGLIVAGVAQKGKFLARVTLAGRRNNWKLASGEIVELSESFAADPQQIENLNGYKAKLKELKFDPKDTGEAPDLLARLPSEYRYAGSAACAKCHVQDGALHSKSPHAHGLDTLHAKNFAFDPYCLKCHTTGYGGPGGFVNADATPQLGGIGCENCHGPSQAHVLEPRAKTPFFNNAKSTCASCHDPENSPKFEYATYWQKILHGQEKAK